MSRRYSRAEWDAKPPKRALVPIGQVSRVFAHHSVMRGTMPESDHQRAIQRVHLDNPKFSDYAYSEGIGNITGDRYEGRGWGKRTGATSGIENPRSVAACAMGNFHPPEKGVPYSEPSDQLLTGFATWIAEGVAGGFIARNYVLLGHRQGEGASSACPGDLLMAKLPEIKRRADALIAGGSPVEPPPDGGSPPPIEIPIEDQIAALWRQLEAVEARCDTRWDSTRNWFGRTRDTIAEFRRWTRDEIARLTRDLASHDHD